MPANPNLFTETFQEMGYGDTLLIMGGSFPDPNRSADIKVGLRLIVPFLHIVTDSSRYPMRDNPLWTEEYEDFETLTLARNDRSFGHDFGRGEPNISYGKKAGIVLGSEVDLIILNPMSRDEYYFIGKSPADDR